MQVTTGQLFKHMQKAYVKVCDQCQHFSNVPRQPSKYLTSMMAPWPFAQWGLDILGPFPLGTKQMKWVEAEPLAKITQQNVKNFVKKNIVYRFRVPRVVQPGVLWAYRTIVRTPTMETPFKLAYGSVAVMPVEVHMANYRVMKY